MNALETHQLAIGYGSKVIGHDLELRLEAGQLVGLIGQNGVGKSTLLRTIAGFQPALDGSILIFGKDRHTYGANDLAKQVSVVLTEKPSAQNLTVLELISLGRHSYSGWMGQLQTTDIEAMERAFEQCQIHYLLDKRLHQLSDGQLQKVMIARALAQDTALILLDEPTSHLDLRNKVEVMDLLKKISETGKAVLISTHEISLSANVCDFFWVMDFGTPIVAGTPHDLIESGDLQRLLHVQPGIL